MTGQETTHRREQRLEPRVERSPYFHFTEAAGARYYEAYNNVYWPLDYGHTDEDEYAAVTERVVLGDFSCERPVELHGPDAVRFADYLCARDLSSIEEGRCKHTVICYDSGEILCEAIVVRPWPNTVWIFNGPVDFYLWARGIALHAGFEVDVRRRDISPIMLTGPKARDVLRSVAPEAADLPFYRWVWVTIAGVEAIVARTGLTGELCFEIFPPDTERAPAIWEALAEAGEPHGLMIGGMVGRWYERGVSDFTHGGGLGLNPFEARLERAVDLDAGDFIGRQALLQVRQAGAGRKLVGLEIDAERLPPMEEFWPVTTVDGEEIGVLNTRHWSRLLGRMLGTAVVRSGTPVGARVKLDTPGGAVSATVVEMPFAERSR